MERVGLNLFLPTPIFKSVLAQIQHFLMGKLACSPLPPTLPTLAVTHACNFSHTPYSTQCKHVGKRIPLAGTVKPRCAGGLLRCSNAPRAAAVEAHHVLDFLLYVQGVTQGCPTCPFTFSTAILNVFPSTCV